jgi:hypothetical protein
MSVERKRLLTANPRVEMSSGLHMATTGFAERLRWWHRMKPTGMFRPLPRARDRPPAHSDESMRP